MRSEVKYLGLGEWQVFEGSFGKGGMEMDEWMNVERRVRESD